MNTKNVMEIEHRFKVEDSEKEFKRNVEVIKMVGAYLLCALTIVMQIFELTTFISIFLLTLGTAMFIGVMAWKSDLK